MTPQSDIRREMTPGNARAAYPYFLTGTGRCGTMFLARLLSLASNSVCDHEKHFRHVSLFRYFQDNDANSYAGDIRNSVIPAIELYKKKNIVYGISSGHMYFSLPILYSMLHREARFVFVVRKPEEFVRSALARGFFDPDHANYCNQIEPGPGAPLGAAWSGMRPFEKCLWYWNMVNGFLLQQMSQYPAGTCTLLRLEELTRPRVLELFAFLGLVPPEDEILETALKRRVNASPGEGHDAINPYSREKTLGPVERWTGEQLRLLEAHTGALRRKLYGDSVEHRGSENGAGGQSDVSHAPPARRIGQAAFVVPAVPIDRLHDTLGFAVPCDYPRQCRETPLDRWKMEINDAPIFRYLYRNFRPKRHLEFGTWQGAGAVYCLEECAATVWTINLPFGEDTPDGGVQYGGDGDSFGLGTALAPQWARRLGLSDTDGCRTDALGFIGRFYLEKGLGHRVCQIYCDSRRWDDSVYPDGFFDSILVDGGHTPEIVASDTQKALRLLRPGGLLLWHDFCPPAVEMFPVTRGVRDGLASLGRVLEERFETLAWIDPSWILLGRKHRIGSGA